MAPVVGWAFYGMAPTMAYQGNAFNRLVLAAVAYWLRLQGIYYSFKKNKHDF
jgi:hypothetical protein